MSQNPESSILDLHERQFRRLTQRASLVVVARAARRVLPLLVEQRSEIAYYWPAEGAIRLAETLAGGGLVTALDANEAQQTLGLNSEKDLWREWTSSRTMFHVRACVEHAAMAARFAAYAVNEDHEFYPTDQSEDVARSVPRAAAVAGLEALQAVQSLQPQTETADLFLDGERALLATDSPVAYREVGLPIDSGPEGPLGPLWPAGPPSWYRLPPYSVRVAGGLPPDGAPPRTPEVDSEMFVASAQATDLALRCLDRSGEESIPDLRVTSRRAFVRGSKAQRLEVAREAIGERLVRLVSGLATESALQDKPPTRVLVLIDPTHFSTEVEQRLAQRLGLSPSADDFADFGTVLASEFRHWLQEHSGQRDRMRGEFEGHQFFVRCPRLRRRPRSE
jgi:hypothetical protein